MEQAALLNWAATVCIRLYQQDSGHSTAGLTHTGVVSRCPCVYGKFVPAAISVIVEFISVDSEILLHVGCDIVPIECRGTGLVTATEYRNSHAMDVSDST